MKNALVLGIICSVFTGSLMSMEEQKNGRLNFVVKIKKGKHHGKFPIRSFSAQDMGFYSDPKDFVGKDILSVVPISTEDRAKLHDAFDKASKDNKAIKQEYALDDKHYVAKITPLATLHNGAHKERLFIQVKEAEVDKQ